MNKAQMNKMNNMKEMNDERTEAQSCLLGCRGARPFQKGAPLLLT
jgi:hypothetical protein